ncbi:hypothetical protein WH87_05305 [Devosia epidermidihirudinis]|uniref:Uncharacterized protein n=1 Tax=Devosia epidermidihirudinis TaxID=1293439 RepID=A0A0F5QFS8_9HYPH|nr:hypothetical protein [Devosia epidermidihirudinis]KKC39586.1 hypothetical protein WH87_05305 [Devosia epidermidihirudinis]
MAKLVHIIRAGKCIAEFTINLNDDSEDEDYIVAARERARTELRLGQDDFAQLLFDVVPQAAPAKIRMPFK